MRNWNDNFCFKLGKIRLFKWSGILALIFFSKVVLVAAVETNSNSNPAMIVRELGHGINLAGALEAPREGLWGVTLREDYFASIEHTGFNTVRVPIRWSTHAALTAPYLVDTDFLKRIDWVVAQTKTHHLHAILDFQNYDELIAEPEKNEKRFLAIWRQIAEHYQHEPSTILFELLNEPHNQMDAEKWNALLGKAIAVIRPTNPNRWIVVGPVSWNKISALPQLVLPADDKFIVATVHYYDPMEFTHQGAPWEKTSLTWLGNQWLGTAAEKNRVDRDFDDAVAWAAAHHRLLLLGEFGTYEKAPLDSRARWTNYVARSAESHGMAWSYWEFCGNFGAYNPVQNQWRTPLLEALKPN
jgi:endoglucanase